MRRDSLLRIAPLALVSVIWACADSPVSPGGRSAAARPPAGAPGPALLDVLVDQVAPDSLSADFTVTPSGGTFVLGRHAVVFPDHAICDPATSGYGPDYWDAPCTPVDTAVQFHAEVRQQDGREWVDFSPQVRFVPTDDPAKYVWIL